MTPFFRSIRQMLAMLLIAVLAAQTMPFYANVYAVEEISGSSDIRNDFESYAVGNLNGQGGWIADIGVSVTEEDAVSGLKSIKITDDLTTKLYGMTYSFPAQTDGRVEWWAKPITKSGLVTQIQSEASSGTKTGIWLGFSREGTFMYQNGKQRVYTSEAYKLDTWYRFSIDFNAANEAYDLFVYGEDGLFLTIPGIAFMDGGIASLNRIRFSTFTNEKATFFVDDVVIRKHAGYDSTLMEAIQIVPETLSMSEGETRNIHLVGTYRDGGLFQLTNDASFISDRPNVATAVYGAVYGISRGSAIIKANWGGLSNEAKVYVYGAGDVPAYIPLDPRPLVRDTGLDSITIVTAVESPWYEAGLELARLLETRWGIHAQVIKSETAPAGAEWPNHTILIGSLENNPHLAALYGKRLTFADAVFPGPGGYQLHTLVNPFSLGGNTTVLAASDSTGLAVGRDRLLQVIKSAEEPKLPWLFEASTADSVWEKLPLKRKPNEADLAEGLALADSLLSGLSKTASEYARTLELLTTVSRYGEAYQMTADPYYGAVYKRLIKGYADFINRYPAIAKAQLDVPANMWVSGTNFAATWRVLEADPMFSDIERKQITSAVYLIFEANNEDFYLNRDYAVAGAKYNHDVFPALSIWFGANYFRDYFKFTDADNWFQKGELMFANNTANINLDEGSDYLMHVPAVALDYALASGNDRFLRKGLRPSADLNALMIDNLGTMSGGGDVYPFGRSSAYTWGHSNVMHAASWFFGDPLYDFLMERTRNGPFTGQNMNDLDYPFHRYITSKLGAGSWDPSRYPLTMAYQVEQAVYDELQSKTPNIPLEVAQSDTFHKLAFREGFDQDDAYMALDGFSAGTHGHEDGNTIIKYSDKGRIFIDDRDYIERGPSHHSGVTIVRDGVLEKKPPFAKLQWGADAGGIGISRSTVPDYNGADWERQIITPGGRFFLVTDLLTFKEPGDFSLEATWQTLGTPTLKEDTFEAEQQGVTMTIQSLDESEMSTYDRYAHFQKYFKTIYDYPYAEKETVLRETMDSKAVSAGDRRTLINVISSASSGHKGIQGRRLSENAVSIKEEDGPEWIAWMGALEEEALSSNGKTHLIGEQEWTAMEATQIRVGKIELTFQEPVIWRIDLTSGQWRAYGLKNAIPHYDNEGNPIDDRVLKSGTIPLNSINAKSLWKSIETKSGDQRSVKPKTGINVEHEFVNGHKDWRLLGRFEGETTTAATGDLNGDGVEELVVAGTDGLISAFDEQGKRLWSFQGKERINEVSVQTVDGISYIFAATENFVLHVLGGDGKQLWSYKFPDDSAHREMKGNLIGLTNVRLAYVNGKAQPPWVMVSTQFRYLYGLTLSGELVYEDMAEHYGIQDMEFLDTDGDGLDEGILGMEYTSMVVWNEKKLGRALGTYGPGWTVVTPVEGWSTNTAPAIALGTKQNNVHVIQYRNGLIEKWRHNVGGEVHDIWAGDANRDGRAEIVTGSEGHQVYSFDDDGTVRWRADVGDRVLNVLSLSQEGEAHVLAGMDNGKLIELSEQGSQLERYQFDGRIRKLLPTDAGTEAWVVLDNGYIYKRKTERD